MSTVNGHHLINNKYVCSDHLPLSITVNICISEDVGNITHTDTKAEMHSNLCVNWANVNEEDIQNYCTITQVLLEGINICTGALVCKDVNCNISKHKHDIEQAMVFCKNPWYRHHWMK